MITTYDLESFIAIEDAVSMDPIADPGACAEPRLEMVAPTSSSRLSSVQNFSAVIGRQVLAQLAR